MLKMLLGWRCCYVEDVKDVATLKMLLPTASKRPCGCGRWAKGIRAFRPWFSGELLTFQVIHKNTEILSTHISTGFYENNMKWWTWQSQNSLKPRTTSPRYVIRVLKSFNVSCSMKTTKHRKTQLKMTFPNLCPAPLQLRSGEPQAFTLYIYLQLMYVHVYTHTHTLLYTHIMFT